MEFNKENQNDDESSVTMLDVLDEEKKREEEYAAVLGASDENNCTYSTGPVKRQALYACLTCCPESGENLNNCAGICLACSYRCHENHELIELYTKRNFRCDCPTERLNGNKCVLNTDLDGPQSRNLDNLYNQNFQGIYCNCHRPYPDPDRTSEESMLQCTVCEDWFHLEHIDAPPLAVKLLDNCCDMICDNCMEIHGFLRDYTNLAMKANENLNNSASNSTVDGGEGENMVEVETEEKPNCSKNTTEEPEAKRRKLDENNQKTKSDVEEKNDKCRRPIAKTDYIKGATFWATNWRDALCQCTTCMDMYKTQKIEFLIDTEDSVKTYEERGMQRMQTESLYEQSIRALASMDRIQQIDVITEYNLMKDQLKEYLQNFVESNQVVTEEDIKHFFSEMRKSG